MKRRRTMSMLGESIRMSWSNISHNKMRSFLTTLGIIIGVTAIITLITVVSGATQEVTNQFTELGAGKVTISASGTSLKRGLSESELDELAAIPYVTGVSPTVSMTASAQSGDAWQEDISVEGKNEAYFRRNDELVKRGRELNVLDMESRNNVCLIDQALMDKLFFGQDPLGETVYVGGTGLTVVGILSDGDSRDLNLQALGSSNDGKLIVPYTTALKLSGTRYVTSVELYVDETDQMDDVVEQAEQVLNAAFNYRDDTYTLINLESLLDTMDTMISMMTSMLTGIASIALLVGGIGIMNMMLVSVTERTTEIGLRKALGAQPGQIQIQFLIESFMLSLLGGLIGMIVGIGLSMLLCSLMNITFYFSSSAVILGVGFSAAVGIIFGWAPARKASNLNPIDALRSV